MATNASAMTTFIATLLTLVVATVSSVSLEGLRPVQGRLTYEDMGLDEVFQPCCEKMNLNGTLQALQGTYENSFEEVGWPSWSNDENLMMVSLSSDDEGQWVI